MDKIEVNFGKRENRTLNFQGQQIIINPRISFETESLLIELYLKDYFEPEERIINGLKYNYLGAELKLKLMILSRQTNVSIVKEDDAEYSNSLISELWDLVVFDIENYDEFMGDLNEIVDEVKKEKELELSVGGVIDGLMKKVSEFMDKLNSISPEEMKQLGEQGSQLLKEIESSPVSTLFKEASKNDKVL